MKINKYIFLLVATTCIQLLEGKEYNPKKIFYGTICYPLSIINPPALAPLLYHGQEIPLTMPLSDQQPKKCTFEIVENRNLSHIYMIITEDFARPKNNEIIALETAAEFPYRLFKLTIITQELLCDNSTTKTTLQPQKSWLIQEMDNKEPVIKIPENTIIFFMDPSFVSLENVTWAIDDAVAKLPTIAFNNELDQKTLDATATKLLLSSYLDFRPLHKKVKPIQKTAHNRIISVPGPVNRFIG